MRRNGFTAIELVAAVTVLLLIASMIGMIFAKGDRIWTRGTHAARHRNAGRMAMDWLAQDIGQAIADDWFPFVIGAGGTNVFGDTCDELLCVSMTSPGADGTNRAASAVGYRVAPSAEVAPDFSLVRMVRPVSNHLDETAADNVYWRTNWVDEAAWDVSGIVARHVTAFRLSCPHPDGVVARAYDSRSDATNRPPTFVDVFLEVLPEEQAMQLTRLPEDRHPEFIERHAVRYTARIQPCHRWGYGYRGR